MTGPDGGIRGGLQRYRAWVACIPEHEHEMAINRVAFGTASMAYASYHAHADIVPYLPGFAYILLALLILLDLLIRRARSVLRRSIAIVADVAIISYGMYFVGQAASLFYPLYLWLIFGNGFRFGGRYLLAATVCAGIGFVAVITCTPFWQHLPATACGLLAALLILPAYTGVLIAKLSRATRAAEAASQAKSMFLASVSHEFRTPLNAIVGSVSLLVDTSLDREQRDLIASLQAGTHRLLDLVNDVLDLSRLEAGRMPVEPARFALAPLLAEIVTLLKPQAGIKALRLGVHLGAEVPDLLLADRRHLHEILINLVGNAVKFTQAGSVTIHVGSMPAASGRTGLLISVIDTGIGIQPADRGRIFESFAQANGSIIDSFGGTGLGLAICRRLVLLLGGEIGVDSTPGLGSRFWFTLDTAHVEPGRADDKRSGVTPGLTIPRCVLVIDDPTLRMQVATRHAAVIIAQGIEQAMPLLADETGRGVLVLQRDDASRLAEDGALLARLDPARDIACILLSDEALPATQDSPSVWIDTLTSRSSGPSDLPRAIARACTLHPQPLLQDRTVPRTTRRLDILVADDNAINRQVLSKLLKRDGHSATLVEDGDAALDAIAGHAFDLVLMDVNMPVLNGLDATKLHRLSEIDGSHLPIFALTADTSEAMRMRCREAGMDQCLAKPIDLEQMAALVESAGMGLSAPPPPIPGVAILADHPRFRTALPPLDLQVVQELETLGGSGFVDELLASFGEDAAMLVERLSKAVGESDMPAFRNHLHALRSISANIGARALHEASGGGRTLEADDLRTDGADLAQRLAQELDRFRRAAGVRPGSRPDTRSPLDSSAGSNR